MGLFVREKNKPRSFEEITAPKDETEEEKLDIEGEFLEETAKIVERKTPIGVPFDSSEFNALSCFGWKEDKTEKWLIKCAKVWFLIISFVWFLFGTITFAPIIFISNKIDVLFKDRKKSLLVGIGLYTLIVALVVILIIARATNKFTTP